MADDAKPDEESGYSYNPLTAPDPVPEPEPVPASMSMTKSDLQDRLYELSEHLTKAEILEHIEQIENPKDDAPVDPSAPAAPVDTETRTVTIDGVPYTWTAATEDTVPPVALEVYAQSKAAGG
jgi:hypothetical protein